MEAERGILKGRMCCGVLGKCCGRKSCGGERC